MASEATGKTWTPELTSGDKERRLIAAYNSLDPEERIADEAIWREARLIAILEDKKAEPQQHQINPS